MIYTLDIDFVHYRVSYAFGQCSNGLGWIMHFLQLVHYPALDCYFIAFVH